ncbi:MAG: barstar family protein [Lachnospiraceae bacterium]|nr:barstar family protein [Lachnospiraceae bacterium]
MRICILDGNKLPNRELLHNALAESLSFPNWYGRNLDALYDCLTDFHEEAEIRILHEASLKENLGNYALLLLKVLQEAARANPRIRLTAE